MMLRFKKTVLALLLITVLLVLTSCGGPEATYKSANNLLAKGKYAEAAEKFASLGSYEDATYLTIYADACAKGESTDLNTVMEAISTFYDLSRFKDSDMRAVYYWGRFYEMAASRFEKDNMVGDNIVALEKALEYYKTIPLFLDCPARIKALEKDIPAAKDKAYNTAVKEAESGNYFEADEIFGTLGDYKDSEKRITYYDIREAENSTIDMNNQDNAYAIASQYTNMGDYLDCQQRAASWLAMADKIVAGKYDKVYADIETGKYTEAQMELNSFGAYGANDIEELVAYCGIRADEDILIDSTDHENMLAVVARYVALGEFMDCADRAARLEARANEIINDKYDRAIALRDEGMFEEAITAFGEINAYRDSPEQITACEAAIIDREYNIAVGLLNAEKYWEAYNAFISLCEHKDCPKEFFSIASAFEAAGDKAHAAMAYGRANNIREAQIRCTALWNEIAYREVLSSCFYHVFGLQADGTVVYTEYMSNFTTWRDIITISAGQDHCVGLKADGTVVAAGNNYSGRCNVGAWKNIVAISANEWHTVGLKADGTVVAVGSDMNGSCDVNGWSDIVAVSAGGSYTLGLKADGTVIGNGYIPGSDGEISNWKDIVAISAGDDHCVGLKSDGTVVAAGYNFDGECNVSEWTNIVAISAGNGLTVGLKADGTVVAAGSNEDGQCNVSGWNDIVAISTGYRKTWGLKEDGTVLLAGDGRYIDEFRDWRLKQVPRPQR